VGERLPPGGPYAVLVERGPLGRVLGASVGERGAPPPLRDGAEFHRADLRAGAGPPPAFADPAQGFTPLGALAEPGAPAFSWALNDRDRVWADDVAELAEQATRAQWDASVDVPWAAARDLPDHLERAVAQVMTFIAQNEYAALYVPAGFLPHVHPRYAEMVMWLAGHVHDEARTSRSSPSAR
jgi:hypothetical protein